MRIKWFETWVDSENMPLHQPGVYLITNLRDSKKYVGMGKDLFNRLKSHTQNEGNIERLQRAVGKYKLENFLITPLYYMLEYDRSKLLDIESSLISNYDSIKNGYNIVEKAKDCGFGPEFAACVTASWANPKVRENHLRSFRTPEYHITHSRNVKEGLSKPEVRALLSKRGKDRYSIPENRAKTGREVSRALNTPEGKSKHSATSKSNRARPEVKAKFDALIGTYFIITNGITNRRHLKTIPIPKGWWKGKIYLKNREEIRRNQSESAKASWRNGKRRNR